MTLSARSGADVARLHDIQAPVRDRLEVVSAELWRIVAADLPLAEEVGAHLMGMKGKMFRPTLLLLASSVDDTPEPRAVSLAATLEMLHLVAGNMGQIVGVRRVEAMEGRHIRLAA